MGEDPSALIASYLGAYNSGDMDRLRALVAPDYVHHNGSADLTIDDFCNGAAWIRKGLPDFSVTIADVVGAEDRAAVRFSGTGTHSGSFMGETPTALPVTLHGITIYRISDGLIAEDWEAMDEQPIRALLAES